MIELLPNRSSFYPQCNSPMRRSSWYFDLVRKNVSHRVRIDYTNLVVGNAKLSSPFVRRMLEGDCFLQSPDGCTHHENHLMSTSWPAGSTSKAQNEMTTVQIRLQWSALFYLENASFNYEDDAHMNFNLIIKNEFEFWCPCSFVSVLWLHAVLGQKK